MHLMIPFAVSDAPGCTDALRRLRLPRLDALLRRLAPTSTDAADATSLSPPHERVLARHHGMAAADGCIAWAARDAVLAGRGHPDGAWAWISPVHWDVGAHHIDMADPRALALDEAESRALLVAMAPYFLEDGVALEFLAPERWLARGEVFRTLPSASLDRVVGRDIGPWMPRLPSLRRLQNEMQMLLYTHPVNDARAGRGQSSVNSFWVSGSGALPTGTRPQRDPALREIGDLREAALRGDWGAWARAWADLEHVALHTLPALSAGNVDLRLTLCGERNAITFGAAPAPLLQRLRRRWSGITLHSLQHQL